MDLQTIMHFGFGGGPTPTPGGGGELVNGSAQTGDIMLFVVAMLLCVAAASVIMLRMFKAKKSLEGIGSHVKVSSKKYAIALAVVGAIFALIMSFGMVSANSNSALARNNDATPTNAGPLNVDGEINAN